MWAYDSNGYTGKYTTCAAGCTSATVTGLPNGRPYYVAVVGHAPAGWGTAGWSGWVTVAATPAAPTDIRLTSANGQLTTSWKASANAASAAIDSYTVVVYDTVAYTGKYVTVCGTCTSGTVTGLTNGAWYHVVVYPHNPLGWGAAGYSGWMAVAAPTAPQNLRATARPRPGDRHLVGPRLRLRLPDQRVPAGGLRR